MYLFIEVTVQITVVAVVVGCIINNISLMTEKHSQALVLYLGSY